MNVHQESIEQIIFSDEDFFFFRSWLRLNILEVTWQGKFNEEFDDFWKIFFINGLCKEENDHKSNNYIETEDVLLK